jgi:2-succinyl-5-enolpyruvyl-6-hydroxy-3-cyclohexene-1-carboxylate synthase
MSNVTADTAAAFCATLADEWWRHGVRDAVVCPGSRSTPMALALVRHGGLRVSVRLDERGAGFFAIGLALASLRPTVVLTTSGTAAAELHAAVVEAHHAGVPLVVCTADRPPELRDVGAPQTIDQTHLFGRSVRWFGDLGVPDETGRPAWRSFASRAVAEAEDGPLGPGPVHLNMPFREPLIGEPGELPPPRASGRPWHRTAGPIPVGGDAEDLSDLLRPEGRGLIVAGGGADRCGQSIPALSAALGWPVLADPRSGCRLADTRVVGAADALLRDERFAGEMMPEVVVRVGDPWASKVLSGWLSRTAAGGAVHVAVDPHWAWKDAGREAAVHAGGVRVDGAGPAAPTPWLRAWSEAEAVAQAAIDGVLSRHPETTEPGVARALYGHAPADAAIVVSSSMPVRDLEWFGRPRTAAPRVFSNRGANGIDGVVSTALGVAASGAGGDVFALVGDLAVLHDASALVRPASGGPPLPLVIVVLDNDGGGIFNFLPQASELPETEFERLFGTPQRPAVSDLARGCGYPVLEPAAAADVVPALETARWQASVSGLPVFVVAHTERRGNVALHAEIDASVRQSLSGLRAASG